MSILCYHSLDPEWDSPLAVAPRVFQAHVAWLASHRSVVPAAAAASMLSERGTLPRRTTALTFDDGYSDLHTHALPVLARFGVPATVFLVAAAVTGDGRVDWVDDAPAHALRTLDAAQVREMRDAGVEFGSHSLRHATLTDLTYDQCVEDLRESREILEDLVERPVRLLAYPRGRHDDRVRRAAERAGYDLAFALPETPEPAGRYAVPRAGVYGHNGIAALRVKTWRYYVKIRSALR